jgi:STE24 endopeptidase
MNIDNIFESLLLGLTALSFLFHCFVEWLNIHSMTNEVPAVARDYFDQERYAKAQAYLKTNTWFGTIESGFFSGLFLILIAFGSFNSIDQGVRSFHYSSIVTGLLFYGVLGLGSLLLGLPFSIYRTFSIEKKFGFNKTTYQTFWMDKAKAIALALVIGAPLIAAVLWFFEKAGSHAWLWCWIFLTSFQWLMLFLAPVVIMPLFNKFIPLGEGELKQKIELLSEKLGFKINGIFTMDGSKRSTKANAFFTGFGKNKRIVLFDTLIEKHTSDELLGVLAHEIGHFKKKHVFKHVFVSTLSMGLMFFIMSLFLSRPEIFQAFRVQQSSTYAGLFFFGIVYSPVSTLIQLLELHISRKNEYEADHFAATQTGKPEDLARALMKLSADTLSNLTPHRFKVFLEYSHPPVLARYEELMKCLS